MTKHNQKPGVCFHFTGVQHDGCELVETYPRPLPCIKTLTKTSNATCPFYIEPTEEQVAEAEAEWDDVMAAIGRGECPDCEGPLDTTETKRHVVMWCKPCGKTVARGRKSR